MKAVLALEDGTCFYGESIGACGEVVGEIVFNTGMTGYQEILTDPSYYGQIVAMTYPLIGNYGVNEDDNESVKPWVRGFIVRELCELESNWRSNSSLSDYLKKYNIVGIQGIDTRALTTIIREKGTMNGIISTDPEFCYEKHADEINKYIIKDPVFDVSVEKVEHYFGEGYTVAVLDYGIKKNIVRSLLKRGLNVYVFPAKSTHEEILGVNPDGIMLSNGPGDPKDCVICIETLKNLIGKKPIFGICLGHQLMALANGADTGKLKYGHRGSNHPVKDLAKDLTFITSQNHGYTILEESIDKSKMEVSHKNMNDGTIEGIRYLKEPIFTVQFHPEASPGPMDTSYLFDEFVKLIESTR